MFYVYLLKKSSEHPWEVDIINPSLQMRKRRLRLLTWLGHVRSGQGHTVGKPGSRARNKVFLNIACLREGAWSLRADSGPWNTPAWGPGPRNLHGHVSPHVISLYLFPFLSLVLKISLHDFSLTSQSLSSSFSLFSSSWPGFCPSSFCGLSATLPGLFRDPSPPRWKDDAPYPHYG